MNNLKHEIDSSNYDICPYCGGKMVVRFEDKSRLNSYDTAKRYGFLYHPFVYFTCRYCKSRTPSIELEPIHLNMDTIKKSMYEYIHVPEEEEDYKND